MRNPYMLAIAAVFLSFFIINPVAAQAVDRTVAEIDCGPRFQVRENSSYVGCRAPNTAPGISLEGATRALSASPAPAGLRSGDSAPAFTPARYSATVEGFARQSGQFRDCLGSLGAQEFRLNRNRLPDSVMIMTDDGPELLSGIDAYVRFADERAFVCLLIENVTGCERLVNMPDSRRASMYYARPSRRALQGTAPELAGALERFGYVDRDTLYELRRDRINRCRDYLSWYGSARIFPDDRRR